MCVDLHEAAARKGTDCEEDANEDDLKATCRQPGFRAVRVWGLGFRV